MASSAAFAPRAMTRPRPHRYPPVVARPLVAALGQATVAFVGVVPRLADSEEPVELREIAVQVGGGAAVAAATAAALGCRARLGTQIADDFLGGFIVEAVRRAGIDTRPLRVADRRLSAFSFTAVAGDQERRAAYCTSGDVGDLARDDVHADRLLDGADAAIVDGFFPAAQIHLAETARQRGVPVIFDGGVMGEGVGELVALSDVLICSERLAAELAPRGELSDSLVELQRLGPRAVIITLGPAGSIGLHGDELVQQESFPVEPLIDSADAGAVYHGAFVTALLNELPFARCMEFASAAAALSCTALGAWAGIPARDEVIALIREHR
jgi:sulfofructose kinase